MKQAPLTPKRWRRVEYQRLADLGAFEHDPVELIGGQLIVSEPKGSDHAAAVDMAYVALLSAIPPGWTVRGQNPVAMPGRSGNHLIKVDTGEMYPMPSPMPPTTP